MRVKVFEFSTKFWDWTWKIDPTKVENTLKDWFDNNSEVNVKHILHQNLQSFWYPPQLIVVIYYE